MINYTAAAAAASSAPANYSNCSNLNYVQSTKTSDVNAEYSNTLDLSACGGHQYLYECAGLSLHNNHNHNKGQRQMQSLAVCFPCVCVWIILDFPNYGCFL